MRFFRPAGTAAMLLAGSLLQSHAEEKPTAAAEKIDQVEWYAPAWYDSRFFRIEVKDDALRQKLIEVFSHTHPASGLGSMLMIDDHAAKDQGTLVFRAQGKVIHCYTIVAHPGSGKQRTALVSILSGTAKKGLYLKFASLSEGIETDQDFRELLKAIPLPADPEHAPKVRIE